MSIRSLLGTIGLLLSFAPHAQMSKDSLLKIIGENRKDAEEARTLIYLASEYLRSNTDKAKAYSFSALALAQTLGDPDLESGPHSLLITLHTNTGQIDSAQYYLAQLGRLASLHSLSMHAKLHYNYNSSAGLFYKKQSAYKKALPYMVKAAQVSVQMKNQEMAAGQFLNIGNTYMLIGDQRAALRYHLQALRLFEVVNNKRGISFCYQSIANDFLELKQYGKALDYAKKALLLKQQLDDKRGVSTAYTILGEIYTAQQQYPLAMDYYTKAGQIAGEMALKNEEAKIKIGKGRVLAAQKDVERATAFFRTAKELAASTGDTAVGIKADAELMAVQKEQAAASQKEKMLMGNLQSTIRRGDKNDEAATYQQLATHFEKEADFEKALQYFKKYEREKDSLNNALVHVDVARLEGQYKAEIRDKQIQLLRKDQQLYQAQLQRQRSLQWGGLLFLGVLLAAGGVFFNRYRALQRTRRMLELEKIRNGIARDLHDDIGSTLSSIHILSKVMLQQTDPSPAQMTHLKKINGHAATMMESLGDIVWAVNPQNDTVEQVILRMKEFAAEILDGLNIKYEFVETGDLRAVKLDPAKRKDLFLIFKEAVNNAAKYSQCCKIIISLKYDGDNLHMDITDNGKGFNEVEIKRGNGLLNMRERAGNLSAQLHYQSTEGAGTSLHMAIPSHD